MEFSNIVTAYFSPTGTTRKIINAVTIGINTDKGETLDFTLPQGVPEQSPVFNNELVIFGAPGYGGRLPATAVNRLKKLKGNNTPAVVVVVYGNREFEDALLELRNLAVEQGFTPIAGAAFIGEHSYTSPETPVADGRPDPDDITKAEEFGKKINKKLASIGNLKNEKPIDVPGNMPYKDSMPSSDDCAKTNTDLCTLCGTCVTVCPTGAITPDDYYTTDPELCIMCCACVKICPEDARYIDSPRIKKISKWLSENFATPKQPEIFI